MFTTCHLYFLSRLLLVTYTSCQVYYLPRLLLVTFTACHNYFLSRLLLVTFTSCHVYYLSRILLVTFTTCEEYFIARTIPSLSSLVYLLDNVDLFGFLVFISSCSRWIFVWSKCFFLQDKSPHCLSIGLLLLLVMVLMLLLLFLMAEYLNRWTLSDSEWPLRDMALDHSFVTREIVMSNCN